MATMELLAPLDPLVVLATRESRDPLELLDSRDCLAPLEVLVRLERPETEVSQEIRDFPDPLVLRESAVTPVLLDLPVPRDPSEPVDPLDSLVPMVARESLVLLELPVLLDTRAQAACPVSAELLEAPAERGRRERVDTEAPTAMLEEMELVECQDLVDPLDLLVPMVTRVRPVLSDPLAPPGLVEPLESVERLDLLEPLDSLEPLVLMARPEEEESADLLEERETLDLPAPPDLLEALDHLVLLAPPDPLVLVVTTDLLV